MRGWAHCAQLVKAHRMIYDDLRSRDLRSTFDSDLLRSTYICFDADRREDRDGVISLFLAEILLNLFEKKVHIYVVRYFDFLFTPVTSSLT